MQATEVQPDIRNGPIDGWRGISVAMVIIGHLIGYRFSITFQAQPFHNLIDNAPQKMDLLLWNVALRFAGAMPSLGVDIFFVLSGFLITSLLLREEACGSISTKAFYIRRAFRILPAFFAYLTAIFALVYLGAIPDMAPVSFIASGLFLCDFRQSPCPWFVTHTWSLSVEEQFYFAWPLIFAVFYRYRHLALWGTLLFNALFSFIYPLATNFGCIAAGGIVAISQRDMIARYANPWTITAALLLLLPDLLFASINAIHNSIAALRPILLAFIVFGSLDKVGPFAGLIRTRWTQRLGLISYSVYLWQQLFTGDQARPESLFSLLFLPVALVVPAMVSYFVIERPFIKIGRAISREIIKKDESVIPA
jgi:peptidoglycan/LPS O-acetylase OafA/YrhL